MKIFAVKNEKTNYFNRPIFVESENEALTYIQNILFSDSERALYSLKDDLALYELGEIDFVTGKIKPINSVPRFAFALSTIFDSIPKDKLKPSVTKDEMQKCFDIVNAAMEKVTALSEQFKNHKHYRKEIIK